MALDELRKSIEREAREQASKIQKETDAEVERILREARDKASAIRKHAKETSLSEAEQRRRDEKTSLELQANTIIYEAMESVIEREMPEFVRFTVRALEETERDVIRFALKMFSAVAPLKGATVRINRKHAELADNSGANVVPADMHGVVVSSADGKIRADATPDSIIASNMDVMRRILSKGMF